MVAGVNTNSIMRTGTKAILVSAGVVGSRAVSNRAGVNSAGYPAAFGKIVIGGVLASMIKGDLKYVPIGVAADGGLGLMNRVTGGAL